MGTSSFKSAALPARADTKKGSFAQQLRKAAQTVGIDKNPALAALWCSTTFRQRQEPLLSE